MKKARVIFGGLLCLILLAFFCLGYMRVRSANVLHEAVLRDDVSGVEALLEEGVDVNQLSISKAFGVRFRSYPHEYEDDVTALYVAVATGNQSLVKILIERGADVNHPASSPYSTLGRGIMEFMPGFPLHGEPMPPQVDRKIRTAIVEMLVMSGADIHDRRYPGAETPLEMADRLGLDELHKSLLEWSSRQADVSNQRMQREAPVSESVADLSAAVNGILESLSARRSWKTNEVKIWLARPDVVLNVRDDSTPVLIHAWSKNNNDFHVPMIRINSGNTLYQLTEDEYLFLESKKE